MEEEAGTKEVTNEDKIIKEEIFTKIVRAGKRTYFFDINEAKNKSKYLKITESSFIKEGERKRNTFILFKEDVLKFIEAVKEAEKEL